MSHDGVPAPGLSSVLEAATRCVGIGMVEDLHRLRGLDLQLEVDAAARITHRDAQSIRARVPEKNDLDCAG